MGCWISDADLHGEFQHFPKAADPGTCRDHGVIALNAPPVSIDLKAAIFAPTVEKELLVHRRKVLAPMEAVRGVRIKNSSVGPAVLS